MKPRVLILRAAGINCDMETSYAFESAGAATDSVHINRLLQKDVSLSDYDGLAIPGGFSYGDDIAGGKVLAVELLHHLKEPLLDLIDRGGVVLGICNGFQVLVKTGILPGCAERIGVQEVALTNNDSNRYEDRWVTLESVSRSSIFFAPGERIRVPVAHGEGKYVPRDQKVHEAMVDTDRIAFRYVGENGSSPTYPENPNGSQDDVAGLTDGTGRVLGLMPHPERALFSFHDPERSPSSGSENEPGDGDRIFRRAVDYMKG